MSSPRTFAELSGQLGDDLAWRLKEIRDFEGQIARTGGTLRSAFIRAAAVMLYAHWEGLVKKSSSLYLEYVNTRCLARGISLDRLSPGYMALRLWREYQRTREGPDIVLFVSTVSDYLSGNITNIQLPAAIVGEYESQMTASVVRRVASCLLLEYRNIATKEKFIDKVLIATRNKIAHGSRRTLEISELAEIRDQTITLLRTFSSEIENAAAEEKFLKDPASLSKVATA